MSDPYGLNPGMRHLVEELERKRIEAQISAAEAKPFDRAPGQDGPLDLDLDVLSGSAGPGAATPGVDPAGLPEA